MTARRHAELEGVTFVVLDLTSLTIDPSKLHPLERELFDALRGTDARRREWYAGRIAAHAALEAIGGADLAVLRTDEGAPRLAGPNADVMHIAITHGQRIAAAAAAHADAAWPHVGIDVVDANDTPRIHKIAKRVLKPNERTRAQDSLHAQLAWGTREAVAKATRTGMFVFALTKCWTTGVDTIAKTVHTNLDEVKVIYEVLDDGGVLILAGASESALTSAQAAAFPRS